MAFTQEITDQLKRQLDAQRVAKRATGRSDRNGQPVTLSYLEGYDVIDQLNAIFGFDGWEMYTRRVDYFPNVGSNGAYMAVVMVAAGDDKVGREDVGMGLVAGSSGEAHETAVKGAVTDAMKRAARTFGNQFGNSLYDKESPLHGNPVRPNAAPTGSVQQPRTAGNGSSPTPRQNPPSGNASPGGGISDRQVTYAYNLGRDAGMNRVQIDELAETTYGATTVAGLSKQQASAFIDRLKAAAAAVPVEDNAPLNDVPF